MTDTAVALERLDYSELRPNQRLVIGNNIVRETKCYSVRLWEVESR